MNEFFYNFGALILIALMMVALVGLLVLPAWLAIEHSPLEAVICVLVYLLVAAAVITVMNEPGPDPKQDRFCMIENRPVPC